tara:strand:- start:144 stop:359 length:216 start_codon:yes stop_codon:yes gene_type:complete
MRYFQEYPHINTHLSTLISTLCYAVWEINRNKKTKRRLPKDWVPEYRKKTLQEKAKEAADKLRIYLNGNSE